MKCLKCNSNVKESPHNKFTGFKSYRCSNKECNALFDESDFIPEIPKENKSLREHLEKQREDAKNTQYPIGNIPPVINQSKNSSMQTLNYRSTDFDFTHFVGLFRGGKIYSFVESEESYGKKSNFVITDIIKNNKDCLLIDPLDVVNKIQKDIRFLINSYRPKSIEDAYRKIMEEEKNDRLIICANMDILVSEEMLSDPHKKSMMVNSVVHRKYLSILATNLSQSSSLVFFNAYKNVNFKAKNPICGLSRVTKRIFMLSHRGSKVFVKDLYDNSKTFRFKKDYK